jgi:hypothetical protein
MNSHASNHAAATKHANSHATNHASATKHAATKQAATKHAATKQDISFWINLHPDDEPGLLPVLTVVEVQACMQLSCFCPPDKHEQLQNMVSST